jgi:hypothetical protein
MLYVLGRSGKYGYIWDVSIDWYQKERPELDNPRTLQVVLGRDAKVCSVRMTLESFRKFKRWVLVFGTCLF